MIKTFPLTEAILKGFIRNWRYILLLIVFPLFLIGIVFLSFNPDGLRKIPVGFSGNFPDFNIDDYEDTYFSYLAITKYSNVTSCIDDLRVYRQYVCLEIKHEGSYVLQTYYDNTREPVIWEIIERIKSTIDILQKQRSKQIAADFLSKFLVTFNKVGTFKEGLVQTDSVLGSYIAATDQSINKLSMAKAELSNTIYSMDQDIADIKSAKADIKLQKEDMYSSTKSSISDAKRYTYSFNNLSSSDYYALNNIQNGINNIEYRLNYYNDLSNNRLNDVDFRVARYETASSKGKQYMRDIDSNTLSLQTTRSNLMAYKARIESAEREINTIQTEFEAIKGMDAETLVNPIIIRNVPTYIPKVSEQYANLAGNESQAQKIVKGINLISLQTIFPTILLLITFFLSLLISTFICLGEINSPAYRRIKMVKGIFMPGFLSIYLSSLLIVILPLFCILLLGNYLFSIEIFANIGTVVIILFLLSSIFILLGMALAYLIKRESIALLITAFILVFLIFFSGFLLPTERMRNMAGGLAETFPGKVALSAFNKAVFYGQGIDIVMHDIIILFLWLLSMIVIVLGIKGGLQR